MVVYHLFNVACILSIAFGAYLFFITLTEDLKVNIEAINVHTKNKPKLSDSIKIFSEFVQFHSDAKHLSIASRSKLWNNPNFNNFFFDFLDWLKSFKQSFDQYL